MVEVLIRFFNIDEFFIFDPRSCFALEGRSIDEALALLNKEDNPGLHKLYSKFGVTGVEDCSTGRLVNLYLIFVNHSHFQISINLMIIKLNS